MQGARWCRALPIELMQAALVSKLHLHGWRAPSPRPRAPSPCRACPPSASGRCWTSCASRRASASKVSAWLAALTSPLSPHPPSPAAGGAGFSAAAARRAWLGAPAAAPRRRPRHVYTLHHTEKKSPHTVCAAPFSPQCLPCNAAPSRCERPLLAGDGWVVITASGGQPRPVAVQVAGSAATLQSSNLTCLLLLPPWLYRWWWCLCLCPPPPPPPPWLCRECCCLPPPCWPWCPLCPLCRRFLCRRSSPSSGSLLGRALLGWPLLPLSSEDQLRSRLRRLAAFCFFLPRPRASSAASSASATWLSRCLCRRLRPLLGGGGGDASSCGGGERSNRTGSSLAG